MRFIGRLILAEELFVFIWSAGRWWNGPLDRKRMKLWAKLLYGLGGNGWDSVDHWK